ncbi:hypothetical protein CALVIDRAFT_543247 [Calocera viscosa TUFC12733]|uniref:Uncharacterized protein n=1 Tax=Calocera viscosa (strain TUFC12733) TaxID=1330018 RepID=A0A167FT57_CALVF|nr:hypothetical protein CALVIDRAFT_543247 [Calocera viscosa TUFC12733]
MPVYEHTLEIDLRDFHQHAKKVKQLAEVLEEERELDSLAAKYGGTEIFVREYGVSAYYLSRTGMKLNNCQRGLKRRLQSSSSSFRYRRPRMSSSSRTMKAMPTMEKMMMPKKTRTVWN